jgi:hypothetical protein
MKVKLIFSKQGMKIMKQICSKYLISPKTTINGWWIHDLSPEQYEGLKTAENSGILIRTKL